LKILHISEAWAGGIESAVSNYIKATPEFDHYILARLRPGSHSAELPGTYLQASDSLYSFLKAVHKGLRILSPDVIHLHSSFAGLVRLFPGLSSRIVYSPHCFGFERLDISRSRQLVIALIERFLSLKSQVIYSLSGHEAALAARLGHSYVVVGHNYSRAGRIAAGVKTKKIICGVGRICAQKDPSFFANVAKLLANSELEFVWVGDGDAKLKSELEAAGVRVTGWLEQENVQEILGNSHLLIHTARWEGSPMVTLDAVNLDVPVVSRDIPSMSSVGYYTITGGVDEFASEVLAISMAENRRKEILHSNHFVKSNENINTTRQSLFLAYGSADGE
jgi:glycosyltransferase involved in cell wall biosynthesis